MARVIKADPQEKRETPKARRGDKKRQVISKEIYRAQQKAKEVEAKYLEKRQEMLTEGRQSAAQAREEAQATGASEAFAQAASEALAAFRARALRYGDAGDDIKVLALEVVRKVLGSGTRLSADEIGEILQQGLRALRARRTLRVQVPGVRLEALATERPVLMRALEDEPDLIVEAAVDVSPGFARVVTEVGGALCTEQSALDQLATSLEVDESAVAPRPSSKVRALDESIEGTYDFDEEIESELEPNGQYEVDDGFDEFSDESTVSGADPDEFEDSATQVLPAQKKKRARAPLIKPGANADPERTLALDVSSLRDELSQLDDNLDLYTDESVPD